MNGIVIKFYRGTDNVKPFEDLHNKNNQVVGLSQTILCRDIKIQMTNQNLIYFHKLSWN